MAFRFPTRDATTLFFPTMHVHDGTIPESATFDHALYCQGTPRNELAWERSGGPIEDPVGSFAKANGVLTLGEEAWKQGMAGLRANEDVLVPVA